MAFTRPRPMFHRKALVSTRLLWKLQKMNSQLAVGHFVTAAKVRYVIRKNLKNALKNRML